MIEWDLTREEVEELRVNVRRALRRFRDHPDFDDIAQEAWISSCRNWPRCRARYPLPAVVRVCSRGAYSNWIKSKKGRHPKGDPRYPQPPEFVYYADMPHCRWEEAIDPARLVIDRLAQAALAERALNAMTPRQREMVRRTVMAGESYAVAARQMGVAKGTVGVLLLRALKHGRAALAPGGGSSQLQGPLAASSRAVGKSPSRPNCRDLPGDSSLSQRAR